MKWYVKEGDIVTNGSTLADIETPSFTFALSIDDDDDDDEPALVHEIVYPQTPSILLPVNEVIAILFHQKSHDNDISSASHTTTTNEEPMIQWNVEGEDSDDDDNNELDDGDVAGGNVDYKNNNNKNSNNRKHNK
jgi:hypothetical protein